MSLETRIALVTYNVGGSVNPDKDLLDLLSLSAESQSRDNIADIYVIAFQELRAQPQDLLMDMDPWIRAVQNTLNKHRYVNMKTARMQGLGLCLFCLQAHLLQCIEIETTYVKTGFAGLWGNKGALALRVTFEESSICFVNAHLPAHENKMQDRIKDYYNILENTKFKNNFAKEIFLHDYVFFMGDLNFRLADSADDRKLEFNMIDYLIKMGQTAKVMEYDELSEIMRNGIGLHELTESYPSFPPTFKFLIGSQEYDNLRLPAWTDRILYKPNVQKTDLKTRLVEHSYKSHPSYMRSDHKPVSAQFVITSQPSTDTRVVRFEPVIAWIELESNVFVLDVLKDFDMSKKDWIGLYRSDITNLNDYLSYEYVYKLVSWTGCVHDIPEDDTQVDSKPGASLPRPGLSWHTRVLSRCAYLCSFSGVPNLSDLCGGKVVLLYICETNDGALSVLARSNAFHVQQRHSRGITNEVIESVEVLHLSAPKRLAVASSQPQDSNSSDSLDHKPSDHRIGGFLKCFACLSQKHNSFHRGRQ